ncbi:Protein SOK1 [Cyphellophora attinorum]|uniref:Protein SOK1 n=1 Tax=Cyphellophora attinorum TaxID=1664694 RepID=A0A0N0NNE3_9EURO|nr:Protein SOK1 [Phialophora attinorum]KPI41428.1 Protein SOK1 [Phialophora attinorum]
MAITHGITQCSDSGYGSVDSRQDTDPLHTSRRKSAHDFQHTASPGRAAISAGREHPVEIPRCMVQKNQVDVELLRNGPVEPFLTTETLQELDLVFIKHNLALRVDINYNHDLHFTPIAGSRAEDKRIEKEKYLRCLEYELEIHKHKAMGGCDGCTDIGSSGRVAFRSRLGFLFYDVKSLLFLLVPEDDHDVIDANLDVDSVDVVEVATDEHCAPIRDERAVEMADIMTKAALEGDMQRLVIGIERLLLFLECMRLDVANHQIRTYRPLLINEGIHFQIEYFESRIQQGRLNIDGARQWFRELCNQRSSHSQARHASMPWSTPAHGRDVLVHGLVQLCFSTDVGFPITFKHDSSRLRNIQREVQTEIHLQARSDVYRKLLQHLSVKPSAAPPLNTECLLDLLEPEGSRGNSYYSIRPDQLSSLWADNASQLALEITRQAYRAANLPIPDYMFAAAEKNLLQRFSLERQHHLWAKEIACRLERAVLHWCAVFHSMSPLEISDEQRRYQQQKASPLSLSWASTAQDANPADPEPGLVAFDIQDAARRLAHMTVLHWRVWKGLVYLDSHVCKEYNIDVEDVVDPDRGTTDMPPAFDAIPGQIELPGASSSLDTPLPPVS